MELGSEITAAEIGQLNSFYSEFNSRAFEYNLGDTVRRSGVLSSTLMLTEDARFKAG